MTKKTCFAVAIAILVGCVGQPLTAKASGREQTRAYTADCIFKRVDRAKPEGAMTGVVDAVVGGFISTSLGALGKALRAAGEEDVDVVVGRFPAEIEAGNPPQCIFLAKGVWSVNDKRQVPETDKRGRPTGNTRSEEAFTIRKNDGNDSDSINFGNYYLFDPDFILEVAVVRSGGESALRLVPNYFEYRRLIEKDSDLDDKESRGIAFEVAVHPPGEGPKGKSAVGATLALGTMSTGYGYDLRAGTRRQLGPNNDTWKDGYLPRDYTSAWFKTFAPKPQKAKNSKKKAAADSNGNNSGGPGQGPGATAPDGGAGQASDPEDVTKRQTLPRTVTVTFTEIRAPRKFFLSLADVFDSSKDEIQKAAELAVLESKQTEAELAAAKASTTLMTDFVTKLSTAEVAIINFCAASKDATPAGDTDRLSKSSAANVAQRAANLAALAASQPEPYTSFVPAGKGMPADSGFCG